MSIIYQIYSTLVSLLLARLAPPHALQLQQQQQAEAHMPAVKRRKLQERGDLEDLQKEYTLLKRLKKGKMTQHEYNVATGLSSDDDDEAE